MSGWWPVLVAAGAVTFLTRLSFIALLGRVEAPPLLARALRFVPPAVLTAIIGPELLIRGGEVRVAGNPRLLAGAVATAVAFATRSVGLTIAVGMGALWALQAWWP